jgi:CHAD domain-containing protein
VKRAVNAELDRLRQLTAALKQNLELCAKDATIDAVHDIRTGTRRIEALLDTILRERTQPALGESVPQKPGLQPDDLPKTAERWLRLLKRIRRTAAPVRDLDVHRKLLEKFKPQKKAVAPGENAIEPTDAPAILSGPVKQQTDDLDAWLKRTRADQAQPLMKAAPKWAPRVETQLASLEEAMRQSPLRRKASRNAAVTALEAFARLASQMQQLDAGNLHDFRKGAKKARYMAESGGTDEHAGAVGKALKRLQDEIGDWHDWLVLAEEANEALGSHGLELTALIEKERDMHCALAMNITERMRGRLMGEWQALGARPPVRIRPRLPARTEVS